MATTPPILPPLLPVATPPIVVGQPQNPPLPQLPAGMILQGTVSGQDANGHILIKTEAFRLVLSTHYPLQKGAQVSVRLDQSFIAQADKASQPQVRILSVDGKTPQPAPVQQGAAQPTANPQAELAKPVGVLLEMANRAGAATQKTTPEAATVQTPIPQHAPARGVAAEVTLSEGTQATAVLLRPALSQKAMALFAQLTQSALPASQPTPANALRPGLQLQVQVVQSTPAAAAITATAPPPSPVAPPAMAAVSPSASPQAAASEPQVPASSTPLPMAQMKSGYASYARQAPAMMPGAPAPQPASAPTSTALPTSTPASAGATPSGSTMPTASMGAYPSAPAPAAPQQATIPGAALSLVQSPPHLTPQIVEQLLLRAESQQLPQGQMAAVVMGKEPTGALIVQTRLGMFTLPQVQAAEALQQPGSVLTWQVRDIQPAQTATQSLPLSGSVGVLVTASQMTAEWSALSELTNVLQSLHGNMAAQALQRIVPHVGSSMGAGLLFFMNVLRKGDVFEWLGRDVVDKLEQIGKGDLVQRLGNDLAAVRSLFADQPAGNWQAMFFPVMVEKELQHAQMFMKQEADDKKKGGSGTRFIVELELSNLGPMQIDGFIKKRENTTQFDLVMRTMAELPDDIKTDIYGIFDNAQKIAHFNGSLHFRMVSEFPVQPLEEMRYSAQGNDSGSLMA